MATLKKKICLLGSFGVGKTSLVARFVHSLFSDKYHTTVGVKIDKKTVDLGDRAVNLILWDVAGEDDISTLRMSYLRGSAGYVLVADGTRPSTLEVALSLRIDRDLDGALRRRAAQEQISPSALVRRLLRAGLGGGNEPVLTARQVEEIARRVMRESA